MTAWALVAFRSSLKTAQVIMRPACPMIHIAIHNPVCGKNIIADYEPVQFDLTSKTRQSGKTAGEVDIYLIAKNRDKHFLKLQKCMHAWTQNQRIIRSKQEAKDLYDLMVASGRTDAETAATSLLNADWSKSAKLALADSR